MSSLRSSSLLAASLLALVAPTPLFAAAQSSTLLVDLDTGEVPLDGQVSVGGAAGGRVWLSAKKPADPASGAFPRTSIFSFVPGASQAVDLLPTKLIPELNSQVLREVVELPNGNLVFRFTSASSGLLDSSRLVLSDGTEAGTSYLSTLASGDFELLGDRVFFTANDAASGTELWSTDGTLAGTGVFEDLTPGPGSSLFQFGSGDFLATTATHLFYEVLTGTTGMSELRSVAVGAAGSIVLEQTPSAGSFRGQAFGSELLFGWDAGTGLGAELYASDGTPGGTRLVADIEPGSGSSAPQPLASGSSVAYFAATDALAGRELWRTDGQTASRVFDLQPGPGNGVAVLTDSVGIDGDEIVFMGNDGVSGRDPWYSDGTALGTRRLFDADPGGGQSTMSRVAVVGGRFVFVLDWLGELPLPFTSDGTAAGTTPLAPVIVLSGSGRIAELGGRGWFGALPAGEQVEQELWSTDGTPPGTQEAVDVGQSLTNASSAASSFREGPGVVWFRAAVEGTVRLFRSDGTAAGTVEAVSAGTPDVQLYPIATLGQGLVYGRQDAAAGETGFGEPWFSNGVPGQEVSLGDLAPGPAGSLLPLSSQLRQTAVLGNRLFFFAGDGVSVDLWSTDGTAAGTQLVGAVAPALATFFAPSLEVVGDRVAFAAAVGAQETGLWFTDGSAAGTTRISLPQFGINPSFLDVASADERFYGLLSSPAGTWDLWSSDGTLAGTQLAGTVPGVNFPSLRVAGSNVIVCGGKSLVAFDGSGSSQTLLTLGPETASAFVAFPKASRLAYYRVDSVLSTDPAVGLWATDGTPAGTVLVDTDPNFGPPGSSLGSDGSIVFERSGTGTGPEPWISDGTAAGTGLLVDSVSGPLGSDPAFTLAGRVGDSLLFSAEDPLAGRELHALGISAAGGYVNQSYGLGCGTASNPELTLGGEPRLGELVSLDVQDAAASAPVLHFVGIQPDLVPIGACSVLLGAPSLLITDQTDATGTSSTAFQLSTNPLWVGRSVYLQAAVAAPGGPLLGSLELTSAVELVFGI